MVNEYLKSQSKEFLDQNDHQIQIIDQTTQCLKSDIIAGANECSGTAPNLEIIRLWNSYLSCNIVSASVSFRISSFNWKKLFENMSY